jgi:redox-sensitive bicupin YhaK (pirin superfamily)
MGFGALRVLNDDTIAGESGFGAHAHKDFEIITIVEEGTVTHEDNMGNAGTVTAGEVQVMSAGTGVVHAELNREAQVLKLFQIWITPAQTHERPRYDQKRFDRTADSLTLLVSGDGEHSSLMIHQDARLYKGQVSAGKSLSYALANERYGAYVFVIEGALRIGEQTLEARDALGVSNTESFELFALENARFLLIDVPMG